MGDSLAEQDPGWQFLRQSSEQVNSEILLTAKECNCWGFFLKKIISEPGMYS